MGKINIDIGALLGALTKTPTAQDNPLYGASQEQPSYDAQTGTYSSVPAYTDAQGNEIPGTLPSNANTNKPYLTPSSWQHKVHPEQANAIDSINNQVLQHNLLPGIDNAAQLKVRQGNIKLLDPALQPNTSPLSAAASGYGSLDTSPTYINQQNQALLTAQHGLPGLKAATDLNVGQIENVASAGALDRQPREQSILNQDTINRWNKVYGLTPKEIELAEKQVSSDLRFKPTEDSIKQQALKNQLEEQTNLVPAQTRLAETQTGNLQNIASENTQLWPYTKTALDNRMIGDAATSHYLPEMDRFANTIQSDGSIAPFRKNPLGASPKVIEMKGLDDVLNYTKGGGDVIKDSSGKSYSIPVAPPSNIDPLTGGPAISSTNGPTVTHDTSGSMAPPVGSSLSDTTLPSQSKYTDQIPTDVDAIRSEMLRLEPTFYQSPNSMAGMRYKTLKAQLDKLTAPHSHYIIPSMNPAHLSNIP